jgi:hypothetical protein
MGWSQGLLLEVVTSAKNWFLDEEARFNFYVDIVKAFEKEHWSLCQPEAKDVDPIFKKALFHVHPNLI